MKYKIGFHGYEEDNKEDLQVIETIENEPVKSVVQVRFPSQGRSFAYNNDQFDLHKGDIVFVDGKLEGIQGVVTDVSRSFKIKLSDYKRVIAVADTTVKGELYFGGSHMIAFDKNVIPYNKIRSWFLPPENDEEVAVGYDDESFFYEDIEDFKIKPEIADRGFDYYNRSKVVYLCVEGEIGRAIVVGSKPYEVSFDYDDGEISNITCDCFCSYHCKHEFAVLLQLRETLNKIEEYYDDEYETTDYFAAISKSILLSYAVDGEKSGKMRLD